MVILSCDGNASKYDVINSGIIIQDSSSGCITKTNFSDSDGRTDCSESDGRTDFSRSEDFSQSDGGVSSKSGSSKRGYRTFSVKSLESFFSRGSSRGSSLYSQNVSKDRSEKRPSQLRFQLNSTHGLGFETSTDHRLDNSAKLRSYECAQPSYHCGQRNSECERRIFLKTSDPKDASVDEEREVSGDAYASNNGKWIAKENDTPIMTMGCIAKENGKKGNKQKKENYKKGNKQERENRIINKNKWYWVCLLAFLAGSLCVGTYFILKASGVFGDKDTDDKNTDDKNTDDKEPGNKEPGNKETEDKKIVINEPTCPDCAPQALVGNPTMAEATWCTAKQPNVTFATATWCKENDCYPKNTDVDQGCERNPNWIRWEEPSCDHCSPQRSTNASLSVTDDVSTGDVLTDDVCIASEWNAYADADWCKENKCYPKGDVALGDVALGCYKRRVLSCADCQPQRDTAIPELTKTTEVCEFADSNSLDDSASNMRCKELSCYAKSTDFADGCESDFSENPGAEPKCEEHCKAQFNENTPRRQWGEQDISCVSNGTDNLVSNEWCSEKCLRATYITSGLDVASGIGPKFDWKCVTSRDPAVDPCGAAMEEENYNYIFKVPEGQEAVTNCNSLNDHCRLIPVNPDCSGKCPTRTFCEKTRDFHCKVMDLAFSSTGYVDPVTGSDITYTKFCASLKYGEHYDLDGDGRPGFRVNK